MAFNYSPKVITDGLVLYLDAANTRSYPGTGNAWNDLSRSGNNGTLVNGPTFNSGNGGSIVFDGVDDYVTSNLNYNTLNNITLSLWYKWNGVNQLKILTYLGDAGSNGLGFIINNGTNSGTVGNRVSVLYGGAVFNALSTSALLTDWNYLVITRTTTTVTLYSNNVFIDSTTSTPLTTSTYNFRVYGQNVSPGAAGNASMISFYNRALSSTEITQNYNATKTRYGL